MSSVYITMHFVSSQAERRALAHVQDLACLEQREERRQVALVGDVAHEAAHADFLFLSGLISLPVVPHEVLIFYGNIFRLVDETVEIPLGGINAAV
ncbi:MAG: hypothetical protein Q8O44_04555, partial [Syntrophales bacterium]|nr:hypothetical protein [Syntrophales bacterium]